jgi:mono/diheme cytochrome c family protein
LTAPRRIYEEGVPLRLAAILGSFLFAACAVNVPAPPTDTATPSSTGEEVAPRPATMATQVRIGAELFAVHCSGCHGALGEGGVAPRLIGEGALPEHGSERFPRRADFETAKDVWRWMERHMPADNPGALAHDEYGAILAFLLRQTAVALPARPLTTDLADEIPLP